ncbi:hypothetical protein M422DRAFT_257101 [Sphaerobolus stellatus SS14]|uniref:Ubiquitin-like protease family profile domain-containing protein n=1 Tax=Sphaerobolus stellatus (strain SS14) TaxID=990650 RepID=A0A0C9UA78_SPHS4|nr:hypothetical protein M422DRAFT_257101 [Sphaerobolus stellatus SS14]
MRRHAFSALVDILWLGHPIDPPHDPCARQFLVMWKEPSELSEEAKDFAKKDNEVVCRWTLKCAGICGYDIPVAHGPVRASSFFIYRLTLPSSSCNSRIVLEEYTVVLSIPWIDTHTPITTEVSLNQDESVDPSTTEERSDIPQDGAYCNESVQIVLEIYVSDFNVVHIYQQGYHPDASRTDKLLPSKRLRNEVMSRMRLQAATVSAIMKDVVLNHTYPLQMDRPLNTTVLWPQQYPVWRRFTKLQLENMMKGVRKRGRLHDDPFIAIGILARRNPNKIYFYTSHDQDYVAADILQPEASKAQNMPFGVALLNLRLEDHVRRVFFLNLSGFHWTIWEYDISAPKGVKCTAYNTLDSAEYLRGVDQTAHLRICNSFRARMRPKSVTQIPCHPDDDFTVVLTALQKDSSSCGFWTMITAFASLMLVPVPSAELQGIGILGVKRLLAKIWIDFLSGEGGLSSEVLSSVYQTLYPLGLWDSAAPRPDTIPQLKPKDLSLNVPSYQDASNRISQITETNIFFGKFQIEAPQLQEFINPTGCLSSSVISGYLHFYTQDIMVLQDLPGVLPFYIMDISRTGVMASQSTTGIFKPKLKMKTSRLWAKRNIFACNLVLLPWHIERLKHWILIVIHINEKQISVSDSLTHSIQRHHQNICKRVLKFLEYEYKARELGELPLDWGKKLNMYLADKKIFGPLQQDQHSCGLHIIWVAQSLISDNNPFDIDELTHDILQELRERITCRLIREWTTPKGLLSPAANSASVLTGSVATAPLRTLSIPTLPGFSPIVSELPKLVPPGRSLSITHTDTQKIKTSCQIEQSPNVYYPAQIIEVSESECIVEIPGGIVLPNGQQKLHPERHILSWLKARSIFDNPVEDIPAKQIVGVLWPAINDDCKLQQALMDNDDKLDEVSCLTEEQRLLLTHLRRKLPLVWFTILGLQPSLAPLRNEWREYIDGVRPGLGYFKASSNFTERHMALLNAQDKIIIHMIGGLELGWKMSTNGHESDLAHSLGCAILSYHALAFYLNITPNEAYNAVWTKRLSRPQGRQEIIWNLIYSASNSIIQLERFIRSHRIPSPQVDFPDLVYIHPMPPPPLPPPPPPCIFLVAAPPSEAPAQLSSSFPALPEAGLVLQRHSNVEQHSHYSVSLEGTQQFEMTQEESTAQSPDLTPSTGSLARSPPLGIDSETLFNPDKNHMQAPSDFSGRKRNRTYSKDGSPLSYRLRSRKFQG